MSMGWVNCDSIIRDIFQKNHLDLVIFPKQLEHQILKQYYINVVDSDGRFLRFSVTQRFPAMEEKVLTLTTILLFWIKTQEKYELTSTSLKHEFMLLLFYVCPQIHRYAVPSKIVHTSCSPFFVFVTSVHVNSFGWT